MQKKKNYVTHHDVSDIIWVQFFHDECCILICLFLNIGELVGSSTETDNLQHKQVSLLDLKSYLLGE